MRFINNAGRKKVCLRVLGFTVFLILCSILVPNQSLYSISNSPQNDENLQGCCLLASNGIAREVQITNSILRNSDVNETTFDEKQGDRFLDVVLVPSDEDNLQDAILRVRDCGIIIVSDGRYSGENNRDLDFSGRLITMTSENGPANCIINCENQGRAFLFRNNRSGDIIISGFTIVNGNSGEEDGGAVFCYESSPEISNCFFFKNKTSEYASGGAVYIRNPSHPIFDNCLFSGNSANFGGALASVRGAVVSISNCTFNANAGTFGGAIGVSSATLILKNSILWDNSRDEIYSEDSRVTVTYCDVMGGFSGESNINVDPVFVSGPFGEHYLDERLPNPCVNAGSDDSDELYFSGYYYNSWEDHISYDRLTTRNSNLPDQGLVNLGFHYFLPPPTATPTLPPPTDTPLPTATFTPTPSPTPSPTPGVVTPVRTPTPTPTPPFTSTPTPSRTPTHTPTPSPPITYTPTPSPTPTSSPTQAGSPAPTYTPGGEWQVIAASPNMPPPRMDHRMVYDPVSERMFLFGGRTKDNQTIYNDLWRLEYSQNQWQWSEIQPQPGATIPAARYGHAMTYIPDIAMILVFGGFFGTEVTADDNWLYDPATNEWHTFEEIYGAVEMPGSRGFAGMDYNTDTNKVYLAGGINVTGASQRVYYGIWTFDPDPPTGQSPWCQVGSLPLGFIQYCDANLVFTFDKLRHCFINVQYYAQQVVWEYIPSSNDWRSYASSLNPNGADLVSLSYDDESGCSVYFTIDSSYDTFEYNPYSSSGHPEWEPRTTSNPPEAVFRYSLLYFPPLQCHVLFGGLEAGYYGDVTNVTSKYTMVNNGPAPTSTPTQTSTPTPTGTWFTQTPTRTPTPTPTRTPIHFDGHPTRTPMPPNTFSPDIPTPTPQPTTGGIQVVYVGDTLYLGRQYTYGPDAPNDIDISTSCYTPEVENGDWKVYLGPAISCDDDDFTVTRYKYRWYNDQWEFRGQWDLNYRIIKRAELMDTSDDLENPSGYAVVDGNNQVILQSRAIPDPGFDCAPPVRFGYDCYFPTPNCGGTRQIPYTNPENGMRYSEPMLFDFSDHVEEFNSRYHDIGFQIGRLKLHYIGIRCINRVFGPLDRAMLWDRTIPMRTNNTGDNAITLGSECSECRYTEPFYLSIIDNNNNETPLNANQGEFPIVYNGYGYGPETIRFIRYEPGVSTPTPDPSWTLTPTPNTNEPTPRLKVNIGEKPKALRVLHRNVEEVFRFVYPNIEGYSSGTIAEPGYKISERDEETDFELVLRVNDDNDDGGALGQKDNRDELISADDDDIMTIVLQQFQINENGDDENPASLWLSVQPEGALRLYKKTGESSYEVLTPQDYVIENIEQLAGEKLGDVLSGPVTLYAEALDVPAGQLPPEVTIKWVYRPTSYYTIDYGASDQLKIQVRWAVYPKFAVFEPVAFHLACSISEYVDDTLPNDIIGNCYKNMEDPGDGPRECDIPCLVDELMQSNLGLLAISCHGNDPNGSFPEAFHDPLMYFEIYSTSNEAESQCLIYRRDLGIRGLFTRQAGERYFIGLIPPFFIEHGRMADRSFVHLASCFSSTAGENYSGFVETIVESGAAQSAIGYTTSIFELPIMNLVIGLTMDSLRGVKTIGEVYEIFSDEDSDYRFADEFAPYWVLGDGFTYEEENGGNND